MILIEGNSDILKVYNKPFISEKVKTIENDVREVLKAKKNNQFLLKQVKEMILDDLNDFADEIRNDSNIIINQKIDDKKLIGISLDEFIWNFELIDLRLSNNFSIRLPSKICKRSSIKNEIMLINLELDGNYKILSDYLAKTYEELE